MHRVDDGLFDFEESGEAFQLSLQVVVLVAQLDQLVGRVLVILRHLGLHSGLHLFSKQLMPFLEFFPQLALPVLMVGCKLIHLLLLHPFYPADLLQPLPL